MNNRIITCLFLLFGYLLPAQTDTTFLSGHTENAALERQTMVEASQAIFRQDQPVRSMWKWNVAALTPLNAARETPTYWATNFAFTEWPFEFQLTWERKLSRAFSVSAGITGILYGKNVYDEGLFLPYWDVRVEPRWYYQLGRRIREGRQADNLSANYIGLEARYGRVDLSRALTTTSKYDKTTIALNWGIQRRLLNWGYFDLGYGIGLAHTPASTDHPHYTALFSQRRLQIGLAAISPRSAPGSGNYCDALRCFQEDRRLWKIDLLNLLGFSADNYDHSFSIQPSIALEQKIGASPFSVQADISGKFFYVALNKKYNPSGSAQYGAGASAAAQFRWYYLMRQRIARGRSGNNLSGLYAGLRVGADWQADYFSGMHYFSENQVGSFHSISAAPILGVQFRFLRRGYVDLFGGLGLTARTSNYLYSTTPIIKEQNLEAVGGLRVGLAF